MATTPVEYRVNFSLYSVMLVTFTYFLTTIFPDETFCTAAFKRAVFFVWHTCAPVLAR